MISTRINAGTNSRYISLRMMKKVKMMIEMGKSDELDYRTTKLDRIDVIIEYACIKHILINYTTMQ